MSALPILTPGLVAMLIAFAVFGAVLGGVHFAALAWNVRVLLYGQGLAPAVALPLFRLAVAAGGLAFASHYGAGAVLACLAGILAARAMALRLAEVPA